MYAYVHGRTYVAVDPNGQAGVFIAMAIGAAIGAVVGACTAAMHGKGLGGILVDALIGMLAGAAGGAGGTAVGAVLGPGFAATTGVSTGMGTAVMTGGGGGAIGAGVSYNGQWLAAEARSERGGYSAEGLAYSMGLGAGYGALMGFAFQAIFARAPSPTVNQAAKEAAPDAPLLAPDPPEQVGAPRLSEVKRIGAAPPPEPLTEADLWGKAPCVGLGTCGGRGTPQPITTPKPPSEPTSLPNSDQAAGGGPKATVPYQTVWSNYPCTAGIRARQALCGLRGCSANASRRPQDAARDGAL